MPYARVHTHVYALGCTHARAGMLAFFALGCLLSRKRTSARMCAPERLLRQIYLEKKSLSGKCKEKCFFLFTPEKGDYRGLRKGRLQEGNH